MSLGMTRALKPGSRAAPRPAGPAQAGLLAGEAGALRQALVADAPPPLRRLISALVEVPAGPRVLRFLVDHRNTAVTAEDLAALTRVPADRLRPLLALLEEQGLLEAHDVCGLRIYRYRMTAANLDRALAFRAWHQSWLDGWRALGALLGGFPAAD
jgi:hypothetical protein